MWILAILLPPVAVLLTGRIGSFLVNCLLTLCFYVPGMIHALAVVADAKGDRRQRQLIKAMRAAR
jgi:uncharacterized membrane protein YqaE (UPF0057 family)